MGIRSRTNPKKTTGHNPDRLSSKPLPILFDHLLNYRCSISFPFVALTKNKRYLWPLKYYSNKDQMKSERINYFKLRPLRDRRYLISYLLELEDIVCAIFGKITDYGSLQLADEVVYQFQTKRFRIFIRKVFGESDTVISDVQ